MANTIKTTTLPPGPTKRIWVNKAVLPQFGGTSPTSPVWYVECEGVRHSGYKVMVYQGSICSYEPSEGDGPHAYVLTTSSVMIFEAAQEAA